MSKEKRQAAKEIKDNERLIKEHQARLSDHRPGSVLHAYHLKAIQTLTNNNRELKAIL